MRQLTAILLTLSFPALPADTQRPAMPDPGKGYFCLNEGNSLMGQLHGWTHIQGKKVRVLPGLAHVLGYPGHQAEGVGAAGIPIDWAWKDTGKQQEFFNDVAANDITLFTVQPFGFQNRREVEVEAAAAAQMYRHVLKKNPDCPLLIYQTWPAGRAPGGAHLQDLGPALADGGGDARLYLKGLQHCIDDYMDPVAHVLRQEFPGKPVYLIPCPQAMAEVGRRILAHGEFAGMTHIAQLLDGGGRSVHTSRQGVFLTCMVHLASVYRADPSQVDLPVGYETTFAFNLKEGPKPTDLTPEQGKAMAKLAWDVVRTYPATPVSGKEFAFADMTPPAPGRLQAKEVLSAKQALLRWTPATDDTGLDRQALYLNGELIARLGPDADRFYVAGLRSGAPNKVTIRAFDSCFNLADLHVDLEAPPLRGATVILGWDLRPYTLSSRDKDPQTYTLIENVAASESHGVDPTVAAIQYGPGTGRGGRPFRHCMLLSKDTSDSIEAAVAADAYVSFTVAPVAGRTLELQSLILPWTSNAEDMEIALFSSLDGFAAGAAIQSMHVGPGHADVEFPLHREPALQSIDRPVELRIYFAKGGGQTYIGHYGDPDPEPDVVLRGQIR